MDPRSYLFPGCCRNGLVMGRDPLQGSKGLRPLGRSLAAPFLLGLVWELSSCKIEAILEIQYNKTVI